MLKGGDLDTPVQVFAPEELLLCLPNVDGDGLAHR